MLSQLLERLRHENRLNPGGRGCSELRLHHCTPARVTEQNAISKEKKISQVWWCMPVVPATWEVEAGELLEPGRWSLQ